MPGGLRRSASYLAAETFIEGIVFRSYSHAACSVILNSANGEAIVASAGITIAVSIVDIAVIRIDTGMIHSAKEGVNRTELWGWLSTIGISHDDSTGHAIHGPRGSTICGPVEHVVDVFGTSISCSDVPLEQAINRAVSRIDGKPVTGVDAARSCPGLVISREIGAD